MFAAVRHGGFSAEFLLFGRQDFANLAGGFLAVGTGGKGGEEVEFDAAARPADDHADGLAEQA